MLTDQEIEVAISTAMQTLSMETERLIFPALCVNGRLEPTEAYYRGLLEGFVLGIMHAKNLVKINSGTDVEFSKKSRKVFDDAIEKACNHGADADEYATLFWVICYAASKLKFSRELFARRLRAAMFKDDAPYLLGKQDGLYQSAIAHTGMLQPTKKFERYINDIFKSDENMEYGQETVKTKDISEALNSLKKMGYQVEQDTDNFTLQPIFKVSFEGKVLGKYQGEKSIFELLEQVS